MVLKWNISPIGKELFYLKIKITMKKESFLEKISAFFIAIIGIVIMLYYIWLWDAEKMSFEDCVLICILLSVGSIVNTILITGERIINKINELNKEK